MGTFRKNHAPVSRARRLRIRRFASPWRTLSLLLALSLFAACMPAANLPQPGAATPSMLAVVTISPPPPPVNVSISPTAPPRPTLPEGVTPTATISPYWLPPATLTPPASWEFVDPMLGFAAAYPPGAVAEKPVRMASPYFPYAGECWRVPTHDWRSESMGAPYDLWVVRCQPALTESITATVNLMLSPVAPEFRPGVKLRCCVTIGGEPAMEVGPIASETPGIRYVLLHDGHLWIIWMILARYGGGNWDTAVAYTDSFIRSFRFIPRTVPMPTVFVPPPPPPPPAVLTAIFTPDGR